MPKVIDHNTRKNLIVKTALRVFAERGTKDTTLSVIAKECKLSRTTVYQYFKNIDDIFNYAIKTTSQTLFEKYTSPQWMNLDDVADMITKIMLDCYNYAEGHIDEIINFIKSPVSAEIDLPYLIKRNTARIRLAVGRAIRHGIRTGQLKKQNSEQVVQSLIAIFGSYFYQRAYFPEYSDNIKQLSIQYIDALRV